ncbi:MAG: hypothetical protein ACE5HB_02945 [Terriglobia bacterium]
MPRRIHFEQDEKRQSGDAVAKEGLGGAISSKGVVNDSISWPEQLFCDIFNYPIGLNLIRRESFTKVPTDSWRGLDEMHYAGWVHQGAHFPDSVTSVAKFPE